MLAKAPTKTRAQWAKQICASAQRTVDSILETGRLLIAAKKALDHGEFESMIANDLPFDASTARRQMKITRDPRKVEGDPQEIFAAIEENLRARLAVPVDSK
jgi:hypothetical protein